MDEVSSYDQAMLVLSMTKPSMKSQARLQIYGCSPQMVHRRTENNLNDSSPSQM